MSAASRKLPARGEREHLPRPKTSKGIYRIETIFLPEWDGNLAFGGQGSYVSDRRQAVSEERPGEGSRAEKENSV